MATKVLLSSLLITVIVVSAPATAVKVPENPVSRKRKGAANIGQCVGVCIPNENAARQQCSHREDCVVTGCLFGPFEKEGYKCTGPVMGDLFQNCAGQGYGGLFDGASGTFYPSSALSFPDRMICYNSASSDEFFAAIHSFFAEAAISCTGLPCPNGQCTCEMGEPFVRCFFDDLVGAIVRTATAEEDVLNCQSQI